MKKSSGKVWRYENKALPLHSLLRNDKARAFSSAGLEHLPYKQRVGGSNPSTPTMGCPCSPSGLQGFLFCVTLNVKVSDIFVFVVKFCAQMFVGEQ